MKKNYENNEYTRNLSVNMMSSADDYAVADTIKDKLITKTITENDTYNASDDGADGYSSVTVDVAGGSEAFEVIIEVDNNYSIISISKTFSETLQKINSGDYVKFIVQPTNGDPILANGYSVLLNSTTHEFNAILIFLMSGYLDEQIMACQGYKWNSDDTYVNDIMLTSEPIT